MIRITDENFAQTIKDAKGFLMIEFGAEWCGPCALFEPTLKWIAKAYEGDLAVARVNIDDSPLVTRELQVKGVPCLVLFKDGDLKAMKLGALTKDMVETWLEENGV